MKGTKIEEQVQNINENMRNYETKSFFQFFKTTRNTLFHVSYSFVFCETKKEKETVNLSHDYSFRPPPYLTSSPS